MMIQIHNIKGEILHEADVNSLEDCVKDAIEKKISLKMAGLACINLEGVNLQGADFRFTNFSGANLSGANLCDSNFAGAFLHSASLEGVKYNRDSNLNFANLDNTCLESLIKRQPLTSKQIKELSNNLLDIQCFALPAQKKNSYYIYQGNPSDDILKDADVIGEIRKDNIALLIAAAPQIAKTALLALEENEMLKKLLSEVNKPKKRGK